MLHTESPTVKKKTKESRIAKNVPSNAEDVVVGRKTQNNVATFVVPSWLVAADNARGASSPAPTSRRVRSGNSSAGGRSTAPEAVAETHGAGPRRDDDDGVAPATAVVSDTATIAHTHSCCNSCRRRFIAHYTEDDSAAAAAEDPSRPSVGGVRVVFRRYSSVKTRNYNRSYRGYRFYRRRHVAFVVVVVVIIAVGFAVSTVSRTPEHVGDRKRACARPIGRQVVSSHPDR